MDIDITPVSSRTIILTLLLTIGLPVVIAVAAMMATRADGMFRWTLVVAAFAAPVAAILLWTMSRNELRISDGQLAIKAGFYGTRLPVSDLRVDEAHTLSPRDAGEHAARWRQNGIGLPGYQAGWFKLRNGDRAFLLMTSPQGVAVPTRAGTWVVVSPARPAEFLAALADEKG